jgi:uncharacterized protein YbbC (DUF1343 family)
MKKSAIISVFILAYLFTHAQSPRIIPAAERVNVYVPLLKGKRVGVFSNQTSMVGNVHLIDTLKSLGVNITVIFSPEHGFRGTADAGEKVGNMKDPKTGIEVISLYGATRKPKAEDLAKADLLIFDIQDVGVRFYTYISSLQEFMEACFENSKPLMLLDRPNPNGHYVDGPVLEAPFKSFVGMQPVPIVYGMTMAEYGMMIAGEGWLSKKANEKFAYYKTAENSKDTPFHFQMIKNVNYTHKSLYELPVKPSPNIPNIQSIYLYPSTCFFEGTVLSEGRGTNKQFQIFGHPSLPKTLTKFTPRSMDGAKTPKLQDKLCYGWDLSGTKEEVFKKVDNKVQLKWLMDAYKLFLKKDSFWLKPKSGKEEDFFFNKLAGNSTLRKQIMAGKSEAEIRKSWGPALSNFKTIRKKYLLYEDFE